MRSLEIAGALLLAATGCYTGTSAVADDPGLGTAAGDSSGSDSGRDQADDDTSGGEPLDPEVGGCDPSSLTGSTLRRLNRREYRNSVQDLLGLGSLPELALPWDDLNVRGFDNDGSALALDPLAAEQYFDAALVVVENLDAATRPPMAACEEQTGDALASCVEAEAPAWLELAFGRPVDDTTVQRMMGFVDTAATYDQARSALVTFTLTSPLFLYHYKPDVGETGPDAYLVADRLASLLWSSSPDAALIEAAGDGSLLDEARLGAEVDRMLADPRSGRFFDDFSDMWLRLGVLPQKPDADINGELYADMREETRAFFEFAARENLPMSELLRADETYVNGRLAAHYGIASALADEEWGWVELPADRRGLLTQGSILATTASDGFSDPIRRGAWIAEHIVCQEPPPPQGEIPELPLPDPDDPKTVREILEEHRENPACASCHALMDPYGLALEQYDHLGVFRTEYANGLAIDASGELPTGQTFDDALGMVEAMAQGEQFEQCATEYLSAYSVGRALGDDEQCFVELVIDAARGRDEAFGLRDLLATLSTSYLFVNGGNG